MKNIQLTLMLVALSICNAHAYQCPTNTSQNNVLIKKSHYLQDSSPFFKKHEFLSYKPGTEDIDMNNYSINALGNKLQLTGNSWKAVKLKNWFVVKPNSYLEFEFLSNGDEAEVNGVGLILRTASGFHGTRFFQTDGTQTVPSYVQDYHNYSGNKWIKYKIPLWSHFQNTNNKIIEQLVFAGDDDGTQVNQSVYYKNIRLIEDYSAYQLPVSFDHGPIIVEETTNKNYFHHIYPQTIIGPDNNVYPVSGGSIVKRVYSPPNTSIEEVILVKENYYDNLCWDLPINHNTSYLAAQSMSALQSIVNSNNNSGSSVLRNQKPVNLTQENLMYFDPDAIINNTKKPRFVNKSTIYSDQTPVYYFESKDAGQNTTVKSGFVYVGVADCSNVGTGTNTQGNCFDLSGLTGINNSNQYIPDTSFTAVFEDTNVPILTDPNYQYDVSMYIEITDNDNKWQEDLLKQQTTELLINTKYFNEYIGYLTNGSDIESITGSRPESVINSTFSNQAAFLPSSNRVYFAPSGTTYRNKEMTFSRDMGVVAHEYAHAISRTWFGNQLKEGSLEGCAISEGFSDIMGYGTVKHKTGIYDARSAIKAYDNNDSIYGLRNSAIPSETDNISLYTGSTSQTSTCVVSSGPGDSCHDTPGGCPDHNPEFLSGHQMSTIFTHLYHIMTNGGFNELDTHRPDPFGVSADETFTHKGAEKVFFDAMSLGHGSINSVGNDVTFCELRNNMLSVVGDTHKVRVNQAWKQVYQDLDSDSTDDGDGKKCQLTVGTELLKPEISIINTSSNNQVVTDGGGINFGFLDPGYSRTYTLEIKNEGDYKLRLINPGFSGSTGSFTHSGLTNQQLVIDIGASVNINLSFIGISNNSGVNTATFSFETNHPDHETFTINLTGTTNGSQAGADAFEDNDTIYDTTYLEFNGNFQNHNFADDTSDWFHSGGASFSAQECPQYVCNLTLNNVTIPDLCIQEFNLTESDPTRQPPLPDVISEVSPLTCNIQNGNYQISSPISIPTNGACHVFPAGTQVKLSSISGSVSENLSYEIKLTCIQQ